MDTSQNLIALKHESSVFIHQRTCSKDKNVFPQLVIAIQAVSFLNELAELSSELHVTDIAWIILLAHNSEEESLREVSDITETLASLPQDRDAFAAIDPTPERYLRKLLTSLCRLSNNPDDAICTLVAAFRKVATIELVSK